jgi:hypothetical protein
LTCFQRDGLDLVPGCIKGGHGDVASYDYCFDAVGALATFNTAKTAVGCTFENGVCGWTESGKHHWTRGMRTPSYGTGPSKAESTDNGKYFIFLETSYGYTNDISYLSSPVFKFATSMSFFYHMYGKTMNTLTVESHSHFRWVIVWSKKGQQTMRQADPWKSAQVVLPKKTHQVRLKGTKGTSYTGDMAVDTITFSTSAPPPPTICEFETKLACGWSISGHQNWTRGDRTSITDAFTAQNGTYFMFLESLGYMNVSSHTNYTAPSYLTSTNFTGMKYVSFYYHMNGQNSGMLSVEVFSNSKWWDIWTRFSVVDMGVWQPVSLALPPGTSTVRFHGAWSSNSTAAGDIAVDTARLSHLPNVCKCPGGVELLDTACTVDGATMCSRCNMGYVLTRDKTCKQTPDCAFEDTHSCGWTSSGTDHWILGSVMPSQTLTTSLACSFEAAGLAGWTESGKFHWLRTKTSPSLQTGASKARDGAYFMYLGALAVHVALVLFCCILYRSARCMYRFC